MRIVDCGLLFEDWESTTKFTKVHEGKQESLFNMHERLTPEGTSPPIDWKADSRSFDGVAELYDAHRPSYPGELIEDIIQLTGLQPESRILEIGSGTGKATVLFAQRGYAVLCLEPGENLSAVAAKNLAAYPRVRFVQARFEAWDAGEEKFDLVTSAQAFHWVPEEVRYEKTARVLKPGGWLAPFWNMYPGLEGEIRRDLDQVYAQYAPELAKPDFPFEQLVENRARSLRECPYFAQVEVRKYPWSARYATDAYLGLLNTYSDHLRLPPDRRQVLFDQIGAVIDRHGGSINRPYLAVVYLARRVED